MDGYDIWFVQCSQHFYEVYQVLRSFVGKFFFIYFDDIIIYNPTLNSYLKYLHVACETLKKEHLYLNHKKCKFFTDTDTYFCRLYCVC